MRAVAACPETVAPPRHERRLVKAVVLSKLLYVSPAWLGFTNAADKQRLEASVRRAIRLCLYTADDPTLSQLVADMDDNLFANILHNPHHVLAIISDLVVTLCH